MEHEYLIDGVSGKIQLKFERKSERLFIMCHPHPLYQGTMDNKVVTTAIRALSEKGLSTLRFNYRGVEKSEGTYGQGEGEYQDLLAVSDWARAQEGLEISILGGFSFGCYVAYRGAAVLNPEALLLVAPAVEHMDFTTHPLPEMPIWMLQGDADEVVSSKANVRFAEQLAQKKGESQVFFEQLPNVGHFFHGQLLTLKSFIQNHFDRLSGGK